MSIPFLYYNDLNDSSDDDTRQIEDSSEDFVGPTSNETEPIIHQTYNELKKEIVTLKSRLLEFTNLQIKIINQDESLLNKDCELNLLEKELLREEQKVFTFKWDHQTNH